ncbi:dihydrolipoyl dehydrogenase [Bacillus rubiinfantis]|uniref:dihydrolipoyl dehydrogenase n=1 Tax=Bacillus rubiinfantis TaxID=1499680 RepID=UPI0006950B19|nr:dihydrolipoyl dehydrogenase [Bacillus rubiinfantis]
MEEKKLDTVIIGSGPGGYVAAIRAAQLGQRVTIIEKSKIGGTCLHTGCIPSKAIIGLSKKWADFKKSEHIFGKLSTSNEMDMMEFQKDKNKTIFKLQNGIQHLLHKHEIEVVEGTAAFCSNDALIVSNIHGHTNKYSFQHCIIATGSEPRELPSFPWGDRILSSTGALALQSLPEEIAILGGGYIGIELGCAFANLGVKVTIIEVQEDILLMVDPKIRHILKQQLNKKKINLLTGVKAIGYQEENEKIRIQLQRETEFFSVQADFLVVSAGRIPCTSSLGIDKTNIEVDRNGMIQVNSSLQTSVPTIFAIGDVIKGPALAHKASYEGKLAAEVISGNNYVIDYRAIPQVIFSDPEIALTGETAPTEHLLESVFPLGANGRALTLNQSEGLVKIFSTKDTGHVKGGAVIGPNASEVITEITIAIEAGWTVADLALTIHPHPTISEAIIETAELATGMPIHVTSPM